MFFTATAPADGRINLSPKGMDTFRCLDEGRRVAYLDLTGSGNETAAHLGENGRMTVMFCSFSEKPLILRLYGRGRVVRPRDEEWPGLHARFREMPGERQIVPWAPALPPAAPAEAGVVPDLAGGDPRRGEVVFKGDQAKCANCHKIRGQGGAVGPDLSDLFKRDAASVYRDIAEPSAVIHPDYISYTVALKDGRVAVGVVSGGCSSHWSSWWLPRRCSRGSRPRSTATKDCSSSRPPVRSSSPGTGRGSP